MSQTFTPIPSPSPEELVDMAGDTHTDRIDIAAEFIGERNRQITGEGYSLAHDDQHVDGELAQAAAAYASLGARQWADAAQCWPWEGQMNTAHMPREALVIAGALILAEIERLDRAQIASGCTCMEVFGEDPDCKLHGRDTPWAKENPA